MNNFLIRLLIVVIVGFFLIAGVCDLVLPGIITGNQDSIATSIAAELGEQYVSKQTIQAAPEEKEPAAPAKGKKQKKGKAAAAESKAEKQPVVKAKLVLNNAVPTILQKIAEHHLAWIYVTDNRGVILPQTTPFTPDLLNFEGTSRTLSWRTRSYYESVAQVPQAPGYFVHVGFASSLPVAMPENWLSNGAPPAAALLILVFMLAAITGLYVFSIMLPLAKLLSFVSRFDSGALPFGSISIAPSPLEISEMLDLRKLIEGKLKALCERDDAIKDRDNTIRKLNSKMEQELNQAKKEKTVLFLKEAENQFVEKLNSLIEPVTTVAGVSDIVLTQLHSEFPNSFEFALFFGINRKQEASLISHIGFQHNPLEVYKGLGMMKGLAESESEMCTVVEPADLVESQFREIAQLTGARFAIMSPLRCQGRNVALMIVFFRGPDQSLEHITRVLNRVARVTAKSLHHIITYEEQVESSRTDELTGFPNKAYLPHLLPQLLANAEGADGEKRPFSIFLVEGHDVLAINEKYGRSAGDMVIQELGLRIDRLLQQRRTETMGSWGDHLIRYQGAQFLIALRQVDARKATIFAQRLRQVLEGEDFPCGVGKWAVAIGITSFPEDSTNGDELILNVETALSYARGQSERNKIAHINSVPKAFRSAKLASNLGGSLDVFDPAALLQSLSISRKSGILTVTHPEGKMFWCFLENGRPTKARMGKFTGQAAIIEFLVLFESGEFAFSDLASINKQTLDDIGKLPKSFDCPNSLERTLMDGALARDHFASAHDIIKETALYVWPQKSAKNGEGFARLKELKDPPTEQEEKIMKEILNVANGKVQLKSIFERLDNLPTSTLWRAAALMVQNDMVQLKKLATSIAL